jgi:hypothetical protein
MRRAAYLLLLAFAAYPRAGRAQAGVPLGPEFRVNTYTTGQQDNVAVAMGKTPLADFVVVWSSYGQDGSSGGVFAQRYASSGAPLGSEFRVNTYTTNIQRRPSVAADMPGNFVVVWESAGQDGSSYGVFGQRFDSAGAPLGPEFRVNTYTNLQQGYPSLAVGESGDFVVVWSSNGPDGQDYGVFGQRYAGSGAPLGAEFQINTYSTGYQAHPSVAIRSSGQFVVVWTSYAQDGASAGVFGQRFDASGVPAGPEFRVNSYTTGHQGDASVAVASSGLGGFVVIWSSYGQDGSDRGVFGQRFSSGGAPSGPEFRVNTYTTSYQGGPSIGADQAGSFVVVWSSYTQDGSSSGLFGQRYDGAGVPAGSEFRVNTHTTGAQELAAVAADYGFPETAGLFVVAWRSYGQDGSNQGVFGQRFGEIVPVELMSFGVE